MASNVCLIGALPPPVHGMAKINQEMSSQLALQTSVENINIAPVVPIDNRIESGSRINVVLRGLIRAFKSRKQWDVMYIGLSGGLGQLYELLFVILARIFSKELFLHHHSFAYIYKNKVSFVLLSYFAGENCTHISLSREMGEQLKSKYKKVKRVFPLSNIAFIPRPDERKKISSGNLTIGFLSNISFEKGIKLFFESLDLLKEKGVEFEAIIAGPCHNKEVEQYVLDSISDVDNIKYVGAVYGQEKREIFQTMDVLLFPTMYENEAEPLTIYESFSFGIPVISLDRGCIGEIVGPDCGVLVRIPGDFPSVASEQLQEWSLNRDELSRLSSSVREIFRNRQDRARDDLQLMLKRISGQARGDS